MQNNLAAMGQRLAECRRRANPNAFDISTTGARRTPGLRREEVAHLVGVSTTVIEKIERGKYDSLTPQLLNELCNFYKLNEVERRDLFNLANKAWGDQRDLLEFAVPVTVQSLLDAIPTSPAFVMNRRWDIIASNCGLRLLYGDIQAGEGFANNLIWQAFMSPFSRSMVRDWETHTRRILAEFKLDYGRAAGDPRFTKLTDLLAANSSEFRAWWQDSADVRVEQRILKEMIHPLFGALVFDHIGFRLEENPNLLMAIYHPHNAETLSIMQQAVAAVSHKPPTETLANGMIPHMEQA